MKYQEAPKEVQDFIKYVNPDYTAEEVFEDGFEGVYDSIEDWYKERSHDHENEYFEEFEESLGSSADGPYFDYVEVEKKYFCFCWA